MFCVKLLVSDTENRRFIESYTLMNKERFNKLHKTDTNYTYVSKNDIIGTTNMMTFINNCKAFYIKDNKLYQNTTKIK